MCYITGNKFGKRKRTEKKVHNPGLSIAIYYFISPGSGLELRFKLIHCSIPQSYSPKKVNFIKDYDNHVNIFLILIHSMAQQLLKYLGCPLMRFSLLKFLLKEV